MKYCDRCHSSYPTEFTVCPKDQAPLRFATDLMPGMILRDKYEIVEKIGSGGMATVYRARHLVFNEMRALKVVSSRMMDDESFLKRFRNEAVITRKLQHPNAVRIDDIDTLEDGRPYLVMELAQGSSLRAVIEQEGPLPAARALQIARQTAAALGAAHRMGVVHRDIKPDNIIIVRQADGSDLVKVLDFGIAKLRDDGGSAAYTATRTGIVVGTPQYMSPEQASGTPSEQIDGRADLYSLGVALYEMVTGQLPFRADTPMGMLMQHIQAAVPPPRLVRPDLNIPVSASRLLMKLLEKDPAKRFQTAEEMIAAIDHPELLPETRIETPTVPLSSTPTVPLAATKTAAGAKSAVAVAPAPTTAPIVAAAAPNSGARKWVAVVVVAVALLAAGKFLGRRRHAASAAITPPAAQALPPPVPAGSAAATSTAAEERSDRQVQELMTSARRGLDDGQYDAAIRDLQQALALEPENSAARAELKRVEHAKHTEERVLGGH